MQRKRSRGLFITGTGTGVGKTYVASLIARTLAADARQVGVYKPVASGQASINAQTLDDSTQLWEAAGRPGDLSCVCPQQFSAPLAPHLAAKAEGKEVDANQLRRGLDYWLDRSEIVLVEGVGGLLSPVSDDEYVADLALEFAFPLVVVAPNRLGVIHDVLATLVVASTFREGLDVAGVVLNQPTPEPTDLSHQSNLDELRRRAVPPVLGQLNWRSTALNEAVDWFRLAR